MSSIGRSPLLNKLVGCRCERDHSWFGRERRHDHVSVAPPADRRRLTPLQSQSSSPSRRGAVGKLAGSRSTFGRERPRQWIGGTPEPQIRRPSSPKARTSATWDSPLLRAFCQSWRLGAEPWLKRTRWRGHPVADPAHLRGEGSRASRSCRAPRRAHRFGPTPRAPEFFSSGADPIGHPTPAANNS